MADLWTQKIDASVETINNATEADALKALTETDWTELWNSFDSDSTGMDCRPGIGITTDDTFHTLHVSQHPDEEMPLVKFHYPKTKKVMLVPVTYGGVIEKNVPKEKLPEWVVWFFEQKFDDIQKAIETA